MSRLFLVSCILAAVAPARQAIAKLQAQSAAQTITQFGPLPQIAITWMDWLLGICAVMLLIAGLMELLRPRYAPLVALLATTVLWIYFGPGLWAHIAGRGFFEPTSGYATSIPWQQFVYQVGTTVLAAALTYRRHRAALINPFAGGGPRTTAEQLKQMER